MEQNKVRSYFLYAIGEITLVMIGILLALQVNNWNEERAQSQLMQTYYTEMYDELNEMYSNMKYVISPDSILLADIERSLRILDNGNPDSLNILKQTLGSVGTAYTFDYSFPVTEEFIANGFLKSVESDSLKIALRGIKRSVENQRSFNAYLDDQYQIKIEPFFNRNINYAEVIKSKEMVYEGGPPTDFSKLVNNMEAWNIITFKYETTKASLDRKMGMKEFLKFVIRQLDKELS